MDDREMAELAALPAILQYLIVKRQPAHSDMSDPCMAPDIRGRQLHRTTFRSRIQPAPARLIRSSRVTNPGA